LATEDRGEDAETPEDKLEAFVPRLRDELDLLGQREGYRTRAQSFAHWAIHQVSPQFSENTVRTSILPIENGSPPLAVWTDRSARHSKADTAGCLFIARFRWSENAAPTGGELEEELSELTKLTKVARGDARAGLERVEKDLKIARQEGLSLRILLVIDAAIEQERLPAFNESLEQVEKLLPRGSRVEVVDLRYLYDLYLLRLDTYDLNIPETVTIACLGPVARARSVPGPAIVAEVSLSEIYRLVREHQLSLFAKNLRVPISGSRYNAGIQAVLGSSTERGKFWYFNNGITAICDEFKSDPAGPDKAFSLTATHFQIVNGCQSSMTIYNEGARLLASKMSLRPLEETSVLLRVIQLPSEARERAILGQQIARFTNSQSPITGRDLRATDPEQAKFREELTRDWHLFYEAKRSEWKRRIEQNKAFKQNFTWPYAISNEIAGQMYMAFWLQRPAAAKSHKKDIFENEGLYRSIFGVGTSAESLLFPVLLNHLMEDWRLKNGYQKRHRGVGSPHRVSRDKVVTYGDLYVLSMLGTSYQKTFGADSPRKANILELRRATKNVRLVNEKYGGPWQGTLRKLARALESAFEASLEILYNYCAIECGKDQELTIRNLLVRDSTWDDLASLNGPGISQLLASSKVLLLNEFG
jgi:AIPR protein